LASGNRVCVTGATGFIALHLVEQLLDKGYTVNAAIRGGTQNKLDPLMYLQNKYQERLNITTGCDLLKPGSFDTAVEGCHTVFHTASPFWMDDRITDPMKQLVEPAEQGTLNVLKSCEKDGNDVSRVVVTSSFAAVMNVGGNTPWSDTFQYSEEHWNTSSKPTNDNVFPNPVNGHAYRWSKTVAEQAAWNFNSKKFEVSTILPPMVLGVNKQKLTSTDDLNQSSLILYKLLAGQMEFAMPGSVGFVDVSDVAKAHILAAESDIAKGQRYLCSSETTTWIEIGKMLQELFPEFADRIPITCADGSTEQPCLLLKNDKVKRDLGFEFIPLRDTLFAQGKSFIDAGFLQK
jgi:nucleoside-diphosphate-sugar epimerase